MTDYNIWTDARYPSQVTTRMLVNRSQRRSPFDFVVHRQFRSGGTWEQEAQWQNLSAIQRAEYTGLFTRVQRGDHRIRLPWWTLDTIGAWNGTPVTAQEYQVGTELVTFTGATPNQTGWATRGDVFTFGSGITNARIVHQVLVNADTDGSGNVNVEFWPPLFSSVPVGTQPREDIVWGTWLVTDLHEWNDTPGRAQPLASLSVTLQNDGSR